MTGLLIALGALGGCGGSGTPSATAPHAATTSGTGYAPVSAGVIPGALKLAADPSGQLRYSARILRAKAGRVTIEFTNLSPLPHNLTIASLGGTVLAATPTFQGGTRSITVVLQPGKYQFYCSVPGHRAVGMQGSLIVTRSGSRA